MKISKTLALICLLFTTLSSFGQLTIATNKTTNSFVAGEQMQFIIKADTSGVATYNIQYHELAPIIQSGTIMLEAGVETTLDFSLAEPGVAHCVVDIGEKSTMAGASFSAYGIAPFEEMPDDFQAFWAEQKAELEEIPIEPAIWLKESSEYSKTYFLNLPNINGRNIYGYISVPEGEGPFPAILTLPSAGNHADVIVPQASYAENANAISVAISIHSNPIEEESLYAYQHEALNDRDGNYFRYGILAAIRAIDYIYTRSDFDQENLAVNGTSQGGGLALLVAGIDERVDLLISGTPGLCEHSGLLYDRALGWPGFYAQALWGGSPQYAQQTAAAARYYDAAYAASFFDGPALMAISYNDDVVPPATSWAAFNQLGSEHKIMAHALNLGHYAPPDFWRDQMDMLTRYWPDAVINAPAPRVNATTGYFANAGADRQIALDVPLTLEGFITRNGIVNESWPVQWEQISGPGDATFSDPFERMTSVSFNSPGVYFLRFKGEDAVAHQNDQVTYAVMDVVKIVVGEGTISLQSQTIDFDSIPPIPNTTESLELVATASSGLPVSFTVVGGPASIINNTTLILDGEPGFVTIQAHQSGNPYYAPASAWQTFEIQHTETPPVETCTEWINLAKDKAATQSGTQHDADAGRAVDGITDGNFWLTLSVMNTEWVRNAWWEVDLGAVYQIEQINLWNRTDCCVEFAQNYHVLISEEPFGSTSLQATLTQDGVSNFFQVDTVGYPTEIPMEVTGRYVRVQLAGMSFLSLAEIEILGCDLPDALPRKNEIELLENKNSALFDLALSPNPANDYILLETIGFQLNETSKCYLSNTLGKIIDIPFRKENKQTKIDLNNLASGVYYIIVENDGTRIVRTFVKQ